MASLSLTTAFLITQFFLFVIVFAGVIVLRAGESSFSAFSDNPRPATKHFPSFLLGFALITLACIAFSQDLVALSKPVFGDIEFPALSRPDAFLIVFTLNIFGAGVLMHATGGAKDSPFAPVLFTFPALSIFLREPPGRFFTYTGVAVVLFLAFQKPRGLGAAVLENPRQRAAFNVVVLSLLALSTFVGYVTRPT